MKKSGRTFTNALLQYLVLLISMLATPFVFAEQNNDEQIRQLLKDMSEAMRSKDYQGRFMYLLDGKMTSFKIQHAVIDGKEHERLVSLNQKDQEIVRVGHDVYCMHTGNYLFRDKEGVSANPFSGKIDQLDDQTLGFYQLSIEEGKIIAGYNVYQVNFISKDAQRYNRHLWIANKSHLLLKMDITDEMGEVLESFEFTQIDEGVRIPQSEFSHKDFVRHEAKHYELTPEKDTAQMVKPETIKSTWKASWLPQGFYFSGSSHEGSENTHKRVGENKESNNGKEDSGLEMLMYSDGLSAITVFVEEVAHSSVFNESSQQGAVSAYSEIHIQGDRYFMVTSIGEVPLATLERITKGVVFQE